MLIFQQAFRVERKLFDFLRQALVKTDEPRFKELSIKLGSIVNANRSIAVPPRLQFVHTATSELAESSSNYFTASNLDPNALIGIIKSITSLSETDCLKALTEWHHSNPDSLSLLARACGDEAPELLQKIKAVMGVTDTAPKKT